MIVYMFFECMAGLKGSECRQQHLLYIGVSNIMNFHHFLERSFPTCSPSLYDFPPNLQKGCVRRKKELEKIKVHELIHLIFVQYTVSQ